MDTFPEMEALLRGILNTQNLEVLANSCGAERKIQVPSRSS